MAKKKSAEELALEAELNAAGVTEKEVKKSESRAAKQRMKEETKRQKLALEHHADGDGDAAPAQVQKEKRPSKLASLKPVQAFASFSRMKQLLVVVVPIVVIALAAVVIVQVMHSNSTDIWDGTTDVDWYSENATTFTIDTAEQLAGMGSLAEEGVTFEGQTVRLGCNLNMYELELKPLFTGRNLVGSSTPITFRGTFDGGGHTISGLNIMEDTWDCAGLFGSATDGEFCNLTVEGKVTGMVDVGGMIGMAQNVDIKNCTNNCTVSSIKAASLEYSSTPTKTGGLVGMYLYISSEKTPLIQGVANNGDVSARACNAGGVFGQISLADGCVLKMDNVTNNGRVTDYCEATVVDEGVGGIVGYVGEYGEYNFSNITNNGEVVCSSIWSVGGISGVFLPNTATLTNCKNTAKVSANAKVSQAHVGGLFGFAPRTDYTVDKCSNEGELRSTSGNTGDPILGDESQNATSASAGSDDAAAEDDGAQEQK